jgi:hypothetical protein
MNNLMKGSSIVIALLLAGCATGMSVKSGYAGQETRRIKALSDVEIQAYLEGKGQGFAKPAELNGYPGPMHVLELATPLALTAEQRAATEQLMARHKAEVRELGRAYIEAESMLETLLATRLASPESLKAAVNSASALLARIRLSHLETHLTQTALLTEAQRSAYPRLRGYDHDTTQHSH